MYEYDPSNPEGNHPEDIIATIEDELELCRDDDTSYIDWLKHRYEDTNIYKVLESCSDLARKPDWPSQRFADSGEVMQAFVGGGLLGLRIAEQALGKDSFNSSLVKRIGIEVPDDEVYDEVVDRELFEKLYSIYGGLATIVNEGCMLSHQYQDLVDALEAEIMPDRKWQLHVRLGFGFVMYHLYQELGDRLQHEVDKTLPQN